MTTLYLTRHAETWFNKWHKIQGWCDSPLTEHGIDQAKAVHDYFKDKNIKFNRAFCSTAERASDTLELITNYEMSFTRLKQLREMGFGQFEANDERLNPTFPYGEFFVQYGGESMADVQKRMKSAIDEIMSEAKENENVLVVSHAGAILNFAYAVGFDVEKIQKSNFSNCSVLKIKYENGDYQLKEIISPALDI